MANEPRKGMSWKNPNSAGKGPAPSQKRDWHPTAPTKSDAPRKRRSLLLPAIVGAVLLGVLVAAILLYRPTRTPRLFAVGPSNATNLAASHNVVGFANAKGFAEWATGNNSPKLGRDPAEAVKENEWAIGLDEGNEKSIVLFLCLHGGVDSTGPFLWLTPDDATSPEEKHKLRIRDVLSKLKQTPDKKKLLVLDATQIPVNYVHGQFQNDFAKALKGMEKEISDVPNLIVMCSSDEGQRSWVSEEWQKSIFSHSFIEGAKGAAGEDRVTVQKLFEYLQREVSAWAKANRGEEQTPILLPAAAKQMAEGFDLASVTAKSYSAPTPPGANFDVPSQLADAWKARDELSRQNPDAFAPYHWRRHLDTLIRIEQMHRAGNLRADLLDQIDRNKGVLSGSPWPDLSSMGNALPMPAALGLKTQTPLTPGRFRTLFDNPGNVWPDMLKAAPGAVAATRLSLDVCEQLLDLLLREDNPENLTKAGELLNVVYGSEPSPVEAHLIRILARDLDATRPNWALIKQAIELQRLSEQIAIIGGSGPNEFPASEHVYPWIRDAVSKADVDRLRGIDFLISQVPEDWNRSAKLLAEAKAKYDAILNQARDIRQALNTRNNALAELPYYGRWAASLRDEFSGSENDRLLAMVEKIAESAHQLSAMLEEANPARLVEMSVATKTVRDAMDELRGVFNRFINNLNADVLVSKWHHHDNALQVPFIPAKRRLELLAQLRTISSGLNSLSQKVGDGSSKPGSAIGNSLAAAQRHGRVALALLGSRWVNDPSAIDESGGVVKAKFEQLKNLFGSQTLAETSEQIGWHWRALSRRVDQLTRDASLKPLDEALRKLAQADSLARQVDSMCALAKEPDPVSDFRRHRLHHFLLGQARRSVEANWGAANTTATRSYAERTAQQFIDDAKLLILLGADRNASPEDRARLLAAVNTLGDPVVIAKFGVTPGSPSYSLTGDQKKYRFTYNVQRPAGQTPGYPMLRMQSTGPAKMPSEQDARRQPLVDFADRSPVPDRVDGGLEFPVNPSSKEGEVAAEIWHRGHHLRGVTKLLLDNEPSSIWIHHPPRSDPGFAVKASPELRAGAVAIVLDWSGSMDGEKYDQATNALRDLLKGLPAKTRVSFIIFGNTDTGKRPPDRRPVEYDFESETSKLNEIIDDLKKSNPLGADSPIAKAIARAADFGMPTDFKGFKTILVLTDGVDTVDGNNAGDIVYRALNTPATRDIALHMIFFKTAQAEEDKAHKQFQRVKELDIPGEFHSAQNRADLTARLNEAMLPRVKVRRSSDRSNFVQVKEINRDGLPVTLEKSGLGIWSKRLKDETYIINTLLSEETRMRLERGDRLSLEMLRQDGRIRFRPRLFVPDVIPTNDVRKLVVRSTDGQRTIAGLGNCQLVPHEGGANTYDLELLLMVERERNPDQAVEMTHHLFTWVEVKTQNANQGPNPLMARLENVLDMAAPTYKIRVWKWPPLPGDEKNVLRAPSRPAINVWTRHDLPPDKELIRRDTGKTLSDNFRGREFTLIGSQVKVKIESVDFDGEELVVEMSHPPGPAAVFCRPEELKEDANQRLSLRQEHKFYEKSGRYVARFGPLTENEKNRSFTLQFYSMESMKRNASMIELRPEYSPGVNHLLGADSRLLEPITLE